MRDCGASSPLLLAALLSALLVPLACAHHNTEQMIARFTERIEAGESDADLFYRRATEYRVLQMHAEAEADLRRALQENPDHIPARSELARLLSRRGENREALAAAQAAVERATSDSIRAAALVLVARLHAAEGRHEAALHACEAALAAKPRGEVEWYLLHAELLALVDREDERPGALKAGHRATGSIVLRNAWIDALLDIGQPDAVEKIIDRELSASRLKSSWLLRRARLRVLAGDDQGATADLEQCLEELNGRIHPARPDVTLVADRGLANALLGNPEAAAADLARARASGADGWVTAPLERALANSTK